MSNYSIDVMEEIKTHLDEAMSSFHNAMYTDEIYHLEKARLKLDIALKKALHERENWIAMWS